MELQAKQVQKVYLTLLLLNTLAASFIWGINTLFLLDAGLSNTEAFAANAFFTAGMVLFEVPTGIIADTRGRRTSYLLGTITLMASTLLYLMMWQMSAPFWGWALASVLLGLGFTFFSGATEAWLVDALHATNFKGKLESVFAKGQIVTGIAMLSGSVAGGFVAQATNLGIPYIIRAAILGITAVVALIFMKDMGFTPERSKKPLDDVRKVFKNSIKYGFHNPSVKWIMLAAPFAGGVGIYAFYAAQPYFLELYGNEQAYGIAGLTAAIVAGAQIVGGLTVRYMVRIFGKRTSILITNVVVGGVLLALVGSVSNFWVVVALMTIWALLFAATTPVRQAYLNGLIPSKQRATVLSFDALMSSAGGVVFQPALGKSADVWSYATSYVVSGIIQLMALPFVLLARHQHPATDPIIDDKLPEEKLV
jgi:MFS family permease